MTMKKQNPQPKRKQNHPWRGYAPWQPEKGKLIIPYAARMGIRG